MRSHILPIPAVYFEAKQNKTQHKYLMFGTVVQTQQHNIFECVPRSCSCHINTSKGKRY
jgi:hypothetical protein